jgi:hypothetical protein
VGGQRIAGTRDGNRRDISNIGDPRRADDMYSRAKRRRGAVQQALGAIASQQDFALRKVDPSLLGRESHRIGLRHQRCVKPLDIEIGPPGLERDDDRKPSLRFDGFPRGGYRHCFECRDPGHRYTLRKTRATRCGKPGPQAGKRAGADCDRDQIEIRKCDPRPRHHILHHRYQGFRVAASHCFAAGADYHAIPYHGDRTGRAGGINCQNFHAASHHIVYSDAETPEEAADRWI